MEDKEKNKYPAILFWTGFFINMTANYFLSFPGIILMIIGVFVKWCMFLGAALFVLDAGISLVRQIKIRNTILKSDNSNFTVKEWQDAILSPKWKDNIKDLTESKIKNFEEDSPENYPE